MSFAILAGISLVAIFGPLLALPQRWHLPVLIGELLAGIVLGPTGFDRLHAHNPTFEFLANIGFALIMFVAGTHVPIRDTTVREALRVGLWRAVVVGVVAVPVAFGISYVFDTGHPALYAVLMASSSAAFVLPLITSLKLEGEPIRQLLAQVAIADAACIVALPLAIEPSRAGRAALGALAVICAAVAAFIALRELDRRGYRKRVHRLSEERKFALELRVNLTVLFALAALAVETHVSIMLAGFSYGIVIGAIGEPRRLTRQLFAVTEGFFGPLFFVWLGASLDIRALGDHPSYILLGLVLGGGAIVVHLSQRIGGQRLRTGVLASAQLGVPVAAATLGEQLHLLHPGEGAALIFGALVTIAAATAAGALVARASIAGAAATRTPSPVPLQSGGL